MVSGARRLALALVWLASAVGCGASDPAAELGDAGANVSVGSGPFLPWKQGNRWTFQVSKGGVVSTKVTAIGPVEAVGGTGPERETPANKVTTTKGTSDETVSWQAQVGDRVVRYREQAFHAASRLLELEEHWSPAKLHFDGSAAHLVKGATWLEEYQETKQPATGAALTTTARDRWTVLELDALVTVPAGTFRALVLQKAGSSTAKTYWYARGVGKVKETGGQTEELVSYELPP